MWRFIFYSRLNLNTLENELRVLEESGYRTDRVLLRYWFHLKKGSPKQTDYFFTMSFLKEFGMRELRSRLKKEYNATEIECKWMGCNTIWQLWRITAPLVDRSNIEELRRSYLIHIINQELLLSSFFLSLSIVMLLFIYQATASAGKILGWFICSASLVFFLWRLIEPVTT